MTAALDHVGLTVRDMARAAEFWGEIIGLAEGRSGEVEWHHLGELVGLGQTTIVWKEFMADGVVVELQEYRAPRGAAIGPGDENEPGRMHLSLAVADLDAVVARAEAAGFRTRGGPVRVPAGAGAYAGARLCYLLDGDGGAVELVERP